jgi:hypothetical protein
VAPGRKIGGDPRTGIVEPPKTRGSQIASGSVNRYRDLLLHLLTKFENMIPNLLPVRDDSRRWEERTISPEGNDQLITLNINPYE